MEIWQAIVLSIIEGLTEFLPISSTGHMILTADLLNILHTDFIKSFEIIIQLGAILAIVVLYFKTLTTGIDIWKKVMIAFLPTALVGLAFYQVIKQFLIGNTEVTLIALFAGGILLILLEKIYKESPKYLESIAQLDLKKAALIGLLQSVSLVPGVSRSAATIFGGMFLGLKRKAAVEFSFLLAIPTMAAATILDISQNNFQFSQSELLVLIIGFVGAFITAIITIKVFIRYIEHNNFIAFGIYRIVLAVIFYLLIIY